MSHFDRRMVTVSRRAAAGGLAAGMIYGAGLWAGHQRLNTGKEGTIRQVFLGPAAEVALRAVAALAAPVAGPVLMVSGCAFCGDLVVFR